MLIASYNPKGMGDILVVILNQDTEEQSIQKGSNIVKIYNDQDDEILGFNFLNASQILPQLKGKNGQIHLTQDDLDVLNKELKDEGFNDSLTMDKDPKLVVGYVKSIKPHPDSEHLKITETQIDNDKTVQIVSGSPNMQQDIKVVVAKVGAMMPNGMIIWPGKLKDVESDGMICAGYELGLPNAPQKPGALILPDSYTVGSTFNIDKEQDLFN